ncbi:MAG: HAMP domain-containing histidine kinase [Cyanothece sp. SIO2G6]|nr:HAMP domain-containing histidine kinase [Cyanothece sp. SIO2G6]
MIWSYITVLSLGILIGWRITRFIDRLSTTASPPPDSSIPSPSPPASVIPSPTLVPPTSPSPPPSPPITPLTPHHADLNAAMAHHLGQYKAGFLARTSHELRSPLNRVMSLQQLILADLCDNPEEERDFTRKAYEAAEELLELLNQTTTISKLAHGTFPLKLEPLSLQERLSELLMQTELHAKNRNLCLTIDLPDPDIHVVADLDCFRQVLLNLITTPIYLMDEGYIKVTHQLNPTDQTVNIYVEDERPSTAWSESIDLATIIATETSPNPIAISPTPEVKSDATQCSTPSSWGLSMIATTQLVEAMQGTLTLLASAAAADPHTCIECTFPLASVDNEGV